jgi:hypothetical protein
MTNDAMREVLPQEPIAAVFVSAKQADLVRNGFAHETIKRCGSYVVDYTRHDVALAADRTDDRGLAGRASAAVALIPMAVFGFAADLELQDARFGDQPRWPCE